MAVCIEFIKCSNHAVNNIKVTFGSQKNIYVFKGYESFYSDKRAHVRQSPKIAPTMRNIYKPIQKSIMLCHRVNSMGITSWNITVLPETPWCSTILFFCMGLNQKSGISHC